MFGKYSIENFLKEWKDNKDLHAYLKGKETEKFDKLDSPNSTLMATPNITILDMNFTSFMIISILLLLLWIFAAWSIWKYWDKLPEWIKIVSLIFLLVPKSGGPLLVLPVVYFGKTA